MVGESCFQSEYHVDHVGYQCLVIYIVSCQVAMCSFQVPGSMVSLIDSWAIFLVAFLSIDPIPTDYTSCLHLIQLRNVYEDLPG